MDNHKENKKNPKSTNFFDAIAYTFFGARSDREPESGKSVPIAGEIRNFPLSYNPSWTSMVKSNIHSPAEYDENLIYDSPLIRRSSDSLKAESSQSCTQKNCSSKIVTHNTKFQVKKYWVEVPTGAAKKNLIEEKQPIEKKLKKVGRTLSVDSEKTIYKLTTKSLSIYRSMNTATIQNRMGLSQKTSVSVQTPPQLLQRNYIFEREVVCGGFSILYEVSCAQDRAVHLACKHIRLNDVALSSPLHSFAKEEVSIMSSLCHPNIIELVDVVEVGRDYYILMKFAVNGNINDYLYGTVKAPLTEEATKEWLGHIFSALAFLHRSSIVHRDLKLENFFLDARNRAILGDFGFAVRTMEPEAHRLLSTPCGTAEYMAPEVNMATKFENSNYDPYPADIYSMGVCMFEMLNYAKPFKVNSNFCFGSRHGSSLLSLQNNKEYRLRNDLYFTDECRLLIEQLLEPRSSCRPKADQVLENIWFRLRLR